MIESDIEPRVKFTLPFTPKERVNSDICCFCPSRETCQLVKLADQGNYPNMEIPLGFEFDETNYAACVSNYCLTSKTEIKIRTENELKTSKGDATTMANNIFGNINFEFGLNSDANIASTIMGVAVKNGKNWRIYDKEKNQITDVGDLKIGDLPIYIKPTTKVNVGDLIKDSGEYYFVMDIKNGVTQTLNAKTGEMKNIIPVKNILGLNFYSKVIALGEDLIKGKDDGEPDLKKLLLLSMISGQCCEDQGDMNQLLPLLFLDEEFGGGDFGIKEIAIISMLNSQNCGQMDQMSQLLPLFLLKDDMSFGCEDDMMEMVLMMTAIPNMSNNPIMGYLLMTKLMEKKEKSNLALPNSVQQLSGKQEKENFDGDGYNDDDDDDDGKKQAESDVNSDSDADDGNG